MHTLFKKKKKAILKRLKYREDPLLGYSENWCLKHCKEALGGPLPLVFSSLQTTAWPTFPASIQSWLYIIFKEHTVVPAMLIKLNTSSNPYCCLTDFPNTDSGSLATLCDPLIPTPRSLTRAENLLFQTHLFHKSIYLQHKYVLCLYYVQGTGHRAIN